MGQLQAGAPVAAVHPGIASDSEARSEEADFGQECLAKRTNGHIRVVGLLTLWLREPIITLTRSSELKKRSSSSLSNLGVRKGP